MNHLTSIVPSVLLMGEPGSGKTFSLFTILQEGMKVFIITTEPSGLSSLIDHILDTAPDLINNLHYHIVPIGAPSWEDVEKIGEMVHKGNNEQLAKLPSMAKPVRSPYVLFARACRNFTCGRTGKEFGDVNKLGPDAFLVIDGLSGLNVICQQNHTGFKPGSTLPDWQVYQSTLGNLLRPLISGQRNCPFVLIAHIERETSELTGASQITVSTLGKKFAWLLTGMGFSDILLSYRPNGEFFWSNVSNGVVLKRGAHPLSDKLSPSFTPIIASWRRRLKLLNPTN